MICLTFFKEVNAGITSRKVAGSILLGVIGIFHWLNLSGRTVSLESTETLIEMIKKDISWEVKVAGT